MLFIKEPDSNEYSFYPEEFVREALREKVLRGDNPRKYEDGEELAVGGFTSKGAFMAQMTSIGEFNTIGVELIDSARESSILASIEVPDEEVEDRTAENWGIDGVNTHEPRIYVYDDGDNNSHLVYITGGEAIVAEATNYLY